MPPPNPRSPRGCPRCKALQARDAALVALRQSAADTARHLIWTQTGDMALAETVWRRLLEMDFGDFSDYIVQP